MRVYPNGKQVHRSPFWQGFVADNDAVPDIVLNTGLNVIVFKVVNEGIDWRGRSGSRMPRAIQLRALR
jgi:hypothetical protein